MKTMILSIIVGLIKWYIGSGVFARIEALVLEMVKSELTNDEKRQYVINVVKSEYTMLRTRVIDMVIGSVLTKLA